MARRLAGAELGAKREQLGTSTQRARPSGCAREPHRTARVHECRTIIECLYVPEQRADPCLCRRGGVDIGHELTEWFKDPEAGKRFGRTQDLPRHLQASEGGCNNWSDLMCDDPLAPKTEARARELKKVEGGFLGGFADITAYLHRKFVGDPYASRKRKLLDDTRDERVAMGTKHRAEQAIRSAEFMTRNLEAMWARDLPPVARRAALFELWDECGDDDAGKRARAVVVGWIRSHLPAGSADAYTADELAVLAARRTSSAAFAPYAD